MMEKDQLLRWAVKAGAWPEMSNTPEKDIAFLERFAALVAAHEREQACKDSERLDWVEKNGGQHTVCVNGRWYVRKDYGAPHIRAGCLRSAIDEAIRARSTG